MRSTFATHGLPEMLVTDNGSAFTSQEFTDFLRKNGIRHVTSATHPATNGLAERAVQTFKAAMKKAPPNTSIETRVSRFLFHYRLTPHSTTGISPAELLLSRRPRTHLRPDLARKIRRQQDRSQLRSCSDLLLLTKHNSPTQTVLATMLGSSGYTSYEL